MRQTFETPFVTDVRDTRGESAVLKQIATSAFKPLFLNMSEQRKRFSFKKPVHLAKADAHKVGDCGRTKFGISQIFGNILARPLQQLSMIGGTHTTVD